MNSRLRCRFTICS